MILAKAANSATTWQDIVLTVVMFAGIALVLWVLGRHE